MPDDTYTEDDLRLLIEHTATVREMASSAGWELLKDRAAKSIGAQQERILGGNITSLDEYRKHAGWAEGALYVLNLPQRMEHELEEARVRHAEGDDAA